MSNIFITGGSGFIGHELAKSFNDKEDKLFYLLRDLTPSPAKRGVHRGTVIFGDLSSVDTLRRIIADYEIDTIYHLASQAIVRTCANDPVGSYLTNVMGTVNLLEAVRMSGPTVKSIVVSTSDKVYGHAPAPYTEDTPFMPKFTYEATKACQDIVCQNYFHQYGLPVKVVRCSNVYGPADPNMSRLIPNTITKLKNGQAPIIFKDVADYVREFVYVDDVVDAMKLVNDKAAPGEVYCIGGTDAVSVSDVVEMLTSICVQKGIECVPPEFPERAVTHKEIQKQYIDGSKIKALGWTPKVTLEEGLTRTVEYYVK